MLIVLISTPFFASLQERNFVGLNSAVEPGSYFKEICFIASLKFIKFLLIIPYFREEMICQLLG